MAEKLSKLPSQDQIDALKGVFRGEILDRASPAYDATRVVWNGMIDKHPHLIVQAAGANDVAPTIAVARGTALPLAIRGGGHNVAGNGTVDDGIVLNLGRLTEIEVDPETYEVRANGDLLSCEPAEVLPMAQRYFLF